MNSLEAFAYVALGIGSVALGSGTYHLVARLREKWRLRKFNKFIGELKATVEPNGGREVSELMFRDKQGVLSKVRIVIDHDLPDMLDQETTKRMQGMLLNSKIPGGSAGTLEDILSGHSIEESDMEKVQEFVFSPRAVHDMHQAGMSPDEVVTKMLRASGRIA